MFIANNAFAQQSENVIVVLESKYDEFFLIQFLSPEYNYTSVAIEGDIEKIEEKKQIRLDVEQAGTYEITTSYYIEDWDDVILNTEQFTLKKEDLSKTIILQFK